MANKFTLGILLIFSCLTTANAHGDGTFIASDFFGQLQKGDKAAILMVHFGTTHDDTRKRTIDAINIKAHDLFPDIEIREAYTSRIIIKRLKERGIEKLNPAEALKKLHNEGFTHILIQVSTIIDGVEMESLRDNVNDMKNNFKELRIGAPLLHSPEDYEKVINVLTQSYNKKTAYLWVGHGTYDTSTAQYTMLDYMLHTLGHNNCFVGTIEGYPGYEEMLTHLKSSGFKRVVLVPFMFVAGEHLEKDISQTWKENLEKEGFEVTVQKQGLGENKQIQDLYISHLLFASQYQEIGIMEKKQVYEKTGKKWNTEE